MLVVTTFLRMWICVRLVQCLVFNDGLRMVLQSLGHREYHFIVVSEDDLTCRDATTT